MKKRSLCRFLKSTKILFYRKSIGGDTGSIRLPPCSVSHDGTWANNSLRSRVGIPIIHAVPIHEHWRITPSPKQLLKLDCLEPIFEIGEKVQCIVERQKQDVLQTVSNQGTVSQPQNVTPTSLRDIFVNVLPGAAFQRHISVILLIVLQDRATTTPILPNSNPSARYGRTINAVCAVVQPMTILNKGHGLRKFYVRKCGM